jgi:hypothetical protein
MWSRLLWISYTHLCCSGMEIKYLGGPVLYMYDQARMLKK